MKRSLFFPAILLCSSLTAAEPLVWNFDRPGIPKLQNGAHAAPGTARTPEGGRTLQIWAEYDMEELKSPPVLLFPSRGGEGEFLLPCGISGEAETSHHGADQYVALPERECDAEFLDKLAEAVSHSETE